MSENRAASPSAAILDSQSVKTATPAAIEVGYDRAKQTKGGKRHLLVDTLGLVLMIVVTAANVPERAGAKLVLARLHQIRHWIAAPQRSAATLSYERSFFDDFGNGMDNFYEALAALSGRELCVSSRNARILQSYFDVRNMKHPTWLSLHAELEVNHFQDSIRPVLVHYSDAIQLTRVVKAIKQGIDRHIQYFEDLLQEYDLIG